MKGIYDIVERNLEKMTGDNKNDMPNFILNESLGGNAGKWKGLTCAGANFFYDPLNGEIQFFSNCQHAKDSNLIYDPKTKQLKTADGRPATLENTLGIYWEGTFRVAVKMRMHEDELHTKYRIIKMFLPKNTPYVAKANLEETVREYNKRYGFEEPKLI